MFFNLKHAWFLDDGSVVGEATELAQALDVVVRTGPYGMFLNPTNTKCGGLRMCVGAAWGALRTPYMRGPAGVGVCQPGTLGHCQGGGLPLLKWIISASGVCSSGSIQ